MIAIGISKETSAFKAWHRPNVPILQTSTVGAFLASPLRPQLVTHPAPSFLLTKNKHPVPDDVVIFGASEKTTTTHTHTL